MSYLVITFRKYVLSTYWRGLPNIKDKEKFCFQKKASFSKTKYSLFPKETVFTESHIYVQCSIDVGRAIRQLDILYVNFPTYIMYVLVVKTAFLEVEV